MRLSFIITVALFWATAAFTQAPTVWMGYFPSEIQSEQHGYIHLAKSIKGAFKATATAKPTAARTRPTTRRPTQRKSQARPAPAPKGFGTFMSPGGGKIGGLARNTNNRAKARSTRTTPARRSTVKAFRGDFARAAQRGTLNQRFNRVSQRGGLRPKFNRAAMPRKAKKTAARDNLRRSFKRPTKPRLALNGSWRGGPPSGGRATARTGPNPWSLTRTFNRASGATQQKMQQRDTMARAKGKFAHAFRKAAGFPGAQGPITWRKTKPGEVFYRSHNGAVSGRYASLTKPKSARSARNRFALPPGNTARLLSKHVSPGGERVGIAKTAPLFGLPGGGTQAYFPTVPTFKSAGWNKGGLTELFTSMR